MTEFDDDTAVGADGSTRIAAGWDIAGNANGGFLLALAANGLRHLSGRRDPISVTGHFLAPGKPGPATVRGEVIKHGKRLSTVSGALESGGRTILAVLGAFGELDPPAGGFEHIGGGPPDLPPLEECEPRTAEGALFEIPMLDHIDVRTAPGTSPVRGSSPGEVTGWFGFADGRPIDSLALLMVCDAFAPAVFTLDITPAWTPTVEYTVQVRGTPAPGHVRGRFTTRFVQDGYLEEDGEVWDSAGRLVALSRQLAIFPRPAP
jgi:hypothetical protein